MASKYKDDSGAPEPEPPREGVGAIQNSQNQNESERGMSISEVREHSLCDTIDTLQRCQAAAKPNLLTQGRAMTQNRRL